MKHFTLGLLLLLFTSQVYSQETYVVSYREKQQTSTSPPTVKKLLPKTQRLSSSLGSKINASFDGAFSEEMKVCIEAACQRWAERLHFPEKYVNLGFTLKSLGASSDDFLVEVYYYNHTDGTAYTQAYARNYGLAYRNDDIDAEIIINKDIVWDYSWDETTNSSKKSLASAMMRAVGRSLGFGTSLYNNPARGITFESKGLFNPYEKLVLNSNNVYLNTFPNNGRGDAALTTFVTTNNVYIKNRNNTDYQLYVPSAFKDYYSLNYFNKTGSVMSYALNQGDKFLQLDDRTLEVMRSIGWTVQPGGIEIICGQIGADGITSAYQSYTFSMRNNTGGSVRSYLWKYELPNLNNKYVTKKTSTSSTFTIDPVDNPSLYKKTVDGDIHGIITLEAEVNGTIMKRTFNVYHGVKPGFTKYSLDDLRLRPNNDYYDIDLSIVFYGTETFFINVEQEYLPTVLSKFVEAPYVANVTIPGISNSGTAWVDIKLVNDHGTTVETIKIEPITSRSQPVNPIGIKEGSISLYNTNIESVEVRNIQGQLILQTKDENAINDLKKGLYIISIKRQNCPVETKKILL